MSSPSTAGILDSLPRELLVHTLSLVSDAKALYNAALTCRTLYSIVAEFKILLLRDITKRIDARVIDVAFTAADAKSPGGWLRSWLPPKRALTIEDVTRGSDTKPAPSQWSLEVLLAMKEMHNAVEAVLAELVSGKYLELNLQEAPMTESEICRFQHALYRAQIICVMHEIQPIRYHWQRHLFRNFYSRYNRMENEQLACIWDMLKRIVHDGTLTTGCSGTRTLTCANV
jgi:hypothetical protein